MGFIRILVLVAIFALAYFIFKKLFFDKSKPKLPNQNSSDKESQTMVKCHLCGIHLPKDQALESNSRYYCCEDHLQKDNP